MPLPPRIIDSHHHLWIPEIKDPDIGYKWLRDIGTPKPFGDPTPIQRNYLLDELLGEQNWVELTASAHLQCDGALQDPVAETQFIERVGQASGFSMAIVGFVDLSAPNALVILQRHLHSRNFRGIRQIISRLDGRPDISFAPVEYLKDQRWQDQFGLLEEFDLSFDLQIYPEQMSRAADFFGNHSNIPIIIDHAGSPYDQSSQGIAYWKENLQTLAQLPHASIKLSGFGMFDRNWNAETIRPLVDIIVDLFGPERIMFGSNFPVDKLMVTYEHCLTSVVSALDTLTATEYQAIFHDNAKRIYRL